MVARPPNRLTPPSTTAATEFSRNEVFEAGSLQRHRFESLGCHACHGQVLLDTVDRAQPAAMPAAESLEKHAPLHGRHANDVRDLIRVRQTVIPGAMV